MPCEHASVAQAVMLPSVSSNLPDVGAMPLHQRAVLAGVLVLGLALRLIGLGDVGLGFDEPQHIYAARAWLATGDPILPSGMYYGRALAYTQLVAASLTLFGDTPFAARLPSALFGTASLAVVFALGRLLLGTGPALLATFFTAVLPFELVWARTCRMYATYQFFYLLALLAFYRGFETDGASDPLTRRLVGTPLGSLLTFRGQLGIAWLGLSLAALIVAVLLHDLAALIGVSVLVYALGCMAVEALHSGVRTALRGRYALFAACAIVVACLTLLFPAALEDVIRGLMYKPSWLGGAQRQTSYYLTFLNAGGQFPLGVFFVLGIVQGILRGHRSALFLAACAGTPIVFHSFVAQAQSARYIYDCFPLVVLLATYAGTNVFRAELERGHAWLFAPGALRRWAVVGAGALLLGGLVFLPPTLRNGTRQALKQSVAFGGEYNVDWSAACAYVRERALSDDTLIASIPLAAAYAGCPRIEYNLDNGESDQFIDVQAELPRHSFADAAAIVDLEALRSVLARGGTFWLLADAERIGNVGNTPADVQGFVRERFEKRWTSEDGTVSIHVWTPESGGVDWNGVE
jgi:4-amino-4-deoxy-L-arabinose transferase-like glycosyltransferase